MNTQRKPRHYSTSHWFIFTILTAGAVASHHFYTDSLREYSESIVIDYQNKVKSHQWVEYIMKGFGLYGNEFFILFLFLMVYNFGNIFKFFILYSSNQICFFIGSILQLLYLSKSQYLSNENITMYACEGSFASPSIRMFYSTVIYLSLHQITFRSSRFEGKFCLKAFWFIISMIMLVFIAILSFLTGLNSLDQLLYGFSLGICLYFFYFFVMNINSNNPKQLSNLINFPIYYYFLLVVGCIGGYILLFIIQYDSEMTEQAIKVLSLKCKGMYFNKYLVLFNGSLFYFVMSLTSIGTIIGLKAEYKFLFERNYLNWLQYNFEKDEEKNEDDSLMSKLCINKDIQWNHTSLCYSLLRLVFICLIIFISCLPFIFLKIPIDNGFVYLGRIFITANSISFGLFYYHKQILKWIKVTNITLFTIIRESI